MENIISKKTNHESRITNHDYIDKLLSINSESELNKLFSLSQRITRQRFGHTMRLYVPLYLSNNCINSCPYCSFSFSNKIERRSLTKDEILKEADILIQKGHRNILLVSGEDPKNITVGFLEEIVKELKPQVSLLSIEIEPLNYDGYKRLVDAGVDGVTLYQETYDKNTYESLHTSGPKSDYYSRLNAIDDAGKAGMRFIGIGALLGLYDWKDELKHLINHANYLSKKYWKSHISISFPRIQPNASHFKPLDTVNDEDLAKMISITRIMRPDDDLVLSTRESADLRYKLMPLGITRMSAGSKTSPGAYSSREYCGNQFQIADICSAAQVADTLKTLGYDPVWKDWF